MAEARRTPDLLFDQRLSAQSLGRSIGIALAPDDEHVLVGDRYQLKAVIGEGSYGRVYRAFDTQLQREVAIKTVALAGYTEAVALARVAHPNLLRLYDFGKGSDFGYLVLELLEGQTLRQWLVSRQPSAEVLARFVEAGQGLAAMHEAGFVHRDFKPDNVMITRGRAVVVDLGMAATCGSRPLPIGSLRYMAPEQILGEQPCDPLDDQFSFCVALWEALSGRDPFKLSSAAGRFEMIMDGPAGSAPGDRRIGTALRRGLAKTRFRRWPSMQALLAELRPRPRPVLRAIASVVAASSIAVAASTTLLGADERQTDPLAQTLELAELAAREGDGRAAVLYLELALSRARSKFDLDAERTVAEDAIPLSRELAQQGDFDHARECLAVARQVFFDQNDTRSMQRVLAVYREINFLAVSATPASPRSR